MAENYKDIDSLNAQGASEGVSEGANEQFRENLKASQAKAKAIKQQEQKAKQYDNTLAQLVTSLLQEKEYDYLIILIANLVDHNVPSDFLLAVLSLQFEIAFDYANKNISNLSSSALISVNPNTDVFPEEIQVRLKDWGVLIINNAFKDAEKVLETVIQVDTWEIHSSLIHLSAHLIQDFVNTEKEIIDFTQAKDFANHFFGELLESLQSFIAKS